MILIIGLGNPGEKYKLTRHNIGFRAVDEIAANFQFPIFNFQSIFNAKISKGKIANKDIILAKPQTFMNNSGKAVKALVSFSKIKTENLWIIHDDIDLPLGRFKIARGQGAAGHKGIESIIKELGVKDFWRVRIGIQPKIGKPKNVEKFVLQRFTKKEEEITKKVIDEITKKLGSIPQPLS